MRAAFVQGRFMQAGLSCQYRERRDRLGTVCHKASLIRCTISAAGSTTNLIEGFKRLILIGMKGY